MTGLLLQTIQKVLSTVEKAFEIWEQTKEQKSTQLIFCDLSTPKGDGAFNVYDDIKNKLTQKGVPPEEIAFIHDANTEKRKAELFGKVRNGQVRFLLGSTQKMGAGTNVQDRLMKANHTSQKYRLEDNIAKHYPQQIAILKERISGMGADIQTAKTNIPADKEQFVMKVGDKVYTDKKEAGIALVEMCKEIKTASVPATVGEYAGFKMAVSFDSFTHKFEMNVKGQLFHKLEIGADPLGNISRINHALESMPKQLAEAQTKLETVERQLETAKVGVTKPFAQEAELAEKLDRLSALNALLNMDEKGDDALGEDGTPEAANENQDTSGHDLKSEDNKVDSERTETRENAADAPIPYSVENARHNYKVDNGNPQGLKLMAAMADKPVQRASLKEKLETFKVQVAGTGKPNIEKVKGKEETL